MRTSKANFGVALCLYGLAFCLVSKAQTKGVVNTPASSATQEETVVDPNATQFPHDAKTPPPEVTPEVSGAPLLWSGYETHVAFEFGGRSLAVTGNRDVYSTFVNLQAGVRLMDNSLELHSINHNGALFDDFSESAFGLGGDPNEVVRIRASKHKWYDFSGSWRRDLNFFDYNLLGNPLNPLSNKPAVPINVSPDYLDLSRKMLDLNLTVRPQSSLQFQVGYSRYDNGGASTSTVHEGTEALLEQPWHDKSDTFRFGVAWRPLERTRFSYDQFYTTNKSDTGDVLDSFPNALSNGTGVNLGVSFGNASPCATPFVGAAVNPTCNLFTAYSNVAPYHTDIPTEQLGFESNYFRRLHITGRGSYTGAETHMPYSNETFDGLISRGPYVQSITAGSALVKQITTSADAGASYELTERMSLDDQFRWYAYRIPAAASFVQSYLFAASALANPISFPSATCPPPYTSATGCPPHTSASPADQTATAYSMFQGQNQKRNTFELHYQVATHVTGYVGYRFERQNIVVDGDTATVASYFPLLPNRGSCTAAPVNGVCQFASSTVSTAAVEINSHTGLVGVAAQPIAGLRLNADAEISYADNVFTNIMPRHSQLYKGKAIYSPKPWVNLNASARIQEMKDLAVGLGNLEHNGSFSFGAVFPISAKLGVDVNYTYNNFLSNLNICFSETPTPSFGSTTPFCPTGYLTALSYYRDIDHFGTANLMFKPMARATISAGYTITSTNGATLLLNPLAPLGPVAINYHLPTASVAFEIAKHVTFKGGWNLFDYIEKSAPGPVTPRNFEANLLSISLRYTM
jgi:hypothetical protein